MLNNCDPRTIAQLTTKERLQDEVKMFITTIIDTFTEKLRLYVLDRLAFKFNGNQPPQNPIKLTKEFFEFVSTDLKGRKLS